MKSSLLCSTTMILTFVAAVPGAAQNRPPSDGGPADIIVTARRVEERLQDVPISITVYNQQQLTNRNIVQGSDLATYTPSLSSNNNFGSLNTSFAIRGFVQDAGTQPSVGVYFADVVAPRGSAISIPAGDSAGPGSFFDLQNVQVLKGPQGTLFGRNTTGGAVLLVPQKPTGRFEGYVEGSYGNYDMKRIQGVINIPLGDKARFRIGVDRNKRDGYVRNDSGVGPNRFYDTDYLAVRASLVADLTPSLENYTILSYSRSSLTGDLEKLIAAGNSGFGFFAQGQLATEAAKGAGFYTVQNGVNDPHARLSQWQAINTTTWRASDALTVKNIAGYAQLKQDLQSQLFSAFWNLGPGGVLGFAASIPAPDLHFTDQSTFSDELQFQGKNGRLTWQAGGYIELSDPLNTVGGRSPTLLSCTNYNTLNCTNPIGFGSISDTRLRTKFRNYGIYAQGTYALTDHLNLTGGIRYTWDRTRSDVVLRTLLLASPGVTAFGGCTNPGVAPPACSSTYSARSQKPTWLIDLDYKPTDEILLYGKYARGYRAGGVAASAPPEAAVFSPERVNNFEVGAKSQFRGRFRGTFNVAAFYNDFSNQQLRYNLYPKPTALGVSQAAATANAGKSRIYGAEVEASITPVTGLVFDVSYTYIKAELLSFTLPTLPASSPYTTAGQSIVKGDPLVLTPKNKVSATATYTLPLDAEIGRVSVGATFTHVDRQLTNYAYRNAAGQLYGLAYVGSRNLLNLNLNWNSVFGTSIDLSAFATNVTKKKYYDFIPGLGTDVLGFETARLGEPRMFGGRIRYRFGG